VQLKHLDLGRDLITRSYRRHKLQATRRKTLPGPGRSSATTALSRPDVTPPCTISPPNRVLAASCSS
jgi:hypothetical protein